jgi:hypothetical protein
VLGDVKQTFSLFSHLAVKRRRRRRRRRRRKRP